MENPIWRTKYLPNSLDEICGRDSSVERLKKIIKEGNFPHLLFVGTEGIGKTTIARLFAREFLGEFYNANFKLVYADVPLTSEERSEARSDAYISTNRIGSLAGKRITTPAFVQVKIKPFVQLKALGDIPFKILVVKNFDSLGSNQQGFRRLMEIYGPNCRMILITTKISSIIPPIVSRCQLFLIPQADLKSFKELMLYIAKNEGLTFKDPSIVQDLYKITEGKISKAIDLLQLCSVTTNEITLDILFQNAQKFQKEMVKELLKTSFQGNFEEARKIARNINLEYKFSAQEFFIHLTEELIKLPLSNFVKEEVLKMIGEADFRAIEGSDDDIQISSLLSKICLLSKMM
ncbi:MAG: AAA family ATPase [Promethearchaeota archaeon]|nr:MAG: AAA family ATPase [Candidatus Lokiarchaeota archaeon]